MSGGAELRVERRSQPVCGGIRVTSLAPRPASAVSEAEKFSARHGGGRAVHLGVEVVELGAVPLELRLLGESVVQAGEVGGERGRRRRGERVDAPRAAPLGRHHAVAAEVSEVAGDPGLREPQHGFEVADAERASRQQMDEAQTGGVAKAVVDAEQLHAAKLRAVIRIRQGKYEGNAGCHRIVTYEPANHFPRHQASRAGWRFPGLNSVKRYVAAFSW